MTRSASALARGRLAREQRASFTPGTGTGEPSGTFCSRRESGPILDQLVQSLRVAYRRNRRRAIQTPQVSSAANRGTYPGNRCYSSFSASVSWIPAMSLFAPFVQTETYGPTKMGKTKKVQGKKARRQAEKFGKLHLKAQEVKKRQSVVHNPQNEGMFCPSP